MSLIVQLQLGPEWEVKSFCQHLTKKGFGHPGKLSFGARISLKVPSPERFLLPVSHLCSVHQAVGGESQGLVLISALLLMSCVTTGKSLNLSEPPFLPLEMGYDHICPPDFIGSFKKEL